MVLEIARRFINGEWKTTALDESGGGGAQTVVAETFHVTSAQILNDLQTGGAPITSAPPAGKYIWPLSVLVRFNHVTTNYTLHGSDGSLYVTTANEWLVQNNQGFWYRTLLSGQLLLAFAFDDLELAAIVDDVSVPGALNQALSIFTSDSSTWFEGGDGTLDVSTAYILLPLT